jgi:hypothetical protein
MVEGGAMACLKKYLDLKLALGRTNGNQRPVLARVNQETKDAITPN